jgi:hypothetical protein
MPTLMPRGSALLIYGTDLVANTGSGTLKWNRVTEHNRSPIDIQTRRIEDVKRMANGGLRKFFVADKKAFTVSWDMLPSYRAYTVDHTTAKPVWSAEDLRSFYYSSEGQTSFKIRINMAKDGSNQESTTVDVPGSTEEYTVVFTDCNFSMVKRGLQPVWNVSLTMEEV